MKLNFKLKKTFPETSSFQDFLFGPFKQSDSCRTTGLHTLEDTMKQKNPPSSTPWFYKPRNQSEERTVHLYQNLLVLSLI